MIAAYAQEIDKLLAKLDEKAYDFVDVEQALIGFVNSNAKTATELVQSHKDFSPSSEDV